VPEGQAAPGWHLAESDVRLCGVQMIEVTITDEEMLRWLDAEGKPGYLSRHEWVALRGRQRLIDAGIPLGAVVDPLGDPWVTGGRLEWWEDRLSAAKRFRWYPDNPQ